MKQVHHYAVAKIVSDVLTVIVTGVAIVAGVVFADTFLTYISRAM